MQNMNFGAQGGGGYDAGNQALGGSNFTQAPTGASQLTQAGGGDSSRRVNAEQSLVPITIKQWLQAPNVGQDSSPKIDNRQMNQVQIVGIVRNMNPQETNVTYQIDDSTGVIEVKQWANASDGPPEFRVNQYVRVVGRLNQFGGRRSVNAFKIVPITDFNEVTCHFLQVIEAHIYAKSGGAAPPAAGVMQTNFNQQTFQPQANMGAGGMQNGGGYGANANMNMAAAGMDGENNFSPIQKEVLNAVMLQDQQTGSEEGVHVDHIFKQLDPTGGKIDEIRSAVEFLTNEGHLYSTIDEEHFKATTS